jgi:LPS-assembly protein
VALCATAAAVVGAVPLASAWSDLRVRSDEDLTVVLAWIGQSFRIEDRTRERQPVVSKPKPLQPVPTATTPGRDELVSASETFAEEIRLRLPETPPGRATSVIVGDPLVSEVRVLPGKVGSVLIVFVRQPVRYHVWRTAGGRALRVDVRPRAVPQTAKSKQQLIPTVGESGEVTLDAETVDYDRQTNTIVARGGVSITRPGTLLRADEVLVNRSTYEGEASGNVVLETDDTTVRGEHLELDLDDETGWVEEGEIDLRTTGYIVLGDRIEKGYGQQYSVDNSVITTCRCGGLDPPSWSIASRKLDVDVLGNGRARHITFRVRDRPILYFPYGIFPVNRTRHSGFLLPRVGQSFGTNSTGFLYEQPYYWAINKSSDTTMAFHVETAARIGGVTEYRYALDPESRGTIAAAYFNEFLRSDRTPTFENSNQRVVGSAPTDRWAVFSETQQRLPGGAMAHADAMAVSDDLFFREIDSASFQPAEDEATRTRFYTASRFGVLKAWDRTSLSGGATYYQDLDLTREHEDDEVFQRLPNLDLHARHTLWDRVGLSFAGGGINYQRITGFDGLRLDMHPQVRIPFQVGRFVFGSLDGGVRGTAYHMTDRDRIGECRGEGANGESCVTSGDCPGASTCVTNYRCDGGPQDGQPCSAGTTCPGGGDCVITPTGILPNSDEVRGLVHLGWRLGTEVARTYAFDRWGFQRLKHTIEPQLSYLYVPRIDQEDLPLYDGLDRINRRSLLSYGVVSRILARTGSYAALDTPPQPGTDLELTAPSVREILRASVLQVYDTERKIAGNEHFSDVDFGVRLTPGNIVALKYGATYNVQENDLKAASVGLLLRENWYAATRQIAQLRLPTTLALTYRFIGDDAAAAATPGIEDLTGSLYVRVARFLGLRVQTRYDVRNATVLEFGAATRFISQCDCWMLEVGFDKRAEPEQTAFRAQVILTGIGSIGRSSSGEFVTVPGFRRGDFTP